MGNKILIYTALFGNYDELLEPEVIDKNCDYICITDNKQLKSIKWKIQYLDNIDNPVELNRMYKMLPHRFFSEYDYALYVDSNIKLNKSPLKIINAYMDKAAIAFPRHFMRDCIYDEALTCLRHKKITKAEYETITTELLEANKFPKKYGLAENNILVRNLKDQPLIDVMEEWWVLFREYAARDQLSLMYLLWKHRVSYCFMEESSRNKNDYFSYMLHKHDIRKNKLKNRIILMASMRDKNLINKIIALVLDRI